MSSPTYVLLGGAGLLFGESGVASGDLVWVHSSGWDDFDDSVGGHEGDPFAFVE